MTAIADLRQWVGIGINVRQVYMVWIAQWSPATFLLHEHAVSVRIESISRVDRMSISAHNQFLPSQCAHQHQQAGLRQVEIRQQRIHHAKPVAGINEYVCLAASSFDVIAASSCSV